MPMTLPQVVLKRGREKWIWEGHPWVFRSAVAKTPADVSPGSPVDVVDYRGKFSGRGFYNPTSSITVRIVTHDAGIPVDDALIRSHIQRAIDVRAGWIDGEQTNAYRLVHSEGDFLPGLIVDRYADYLVVQIHSLGMDRLRQTVADVLVDVLDPQGIYERSDVGGRMGEGLETQPVGTLWGTDPPAQVVIRESGAEFVCDIVDGQKTGFFLDQRENRLDVERIAQGADVLNCFCYSGGFSVFAARGGATSVESVDASEPALALARENLARNGFDVAEHPVVQANVFDHLKACREQGRQFDVVIVDPPAFAKSSGALKRARRAYVRLNELAMRVLKPGGKLVSASCSSAVDASLFGDLLKQAGWEARRQVQVLHTHTLSPDHPGLIAFPEGRYLKCYFCVVN